MPAEKELCSDGQMDELEQRVLQFISLELPGQPIVMHVGTSNLVHDLWREVQSLRAQLLHQTLVTANEETTMKRLRAQVGCTDFRQVDIAVPDDATEDEICDQALAKAEQEFGKYEEMEVVDYEETL